METAPGLLVTKLDRPARRADLIPRPGLRDRLGRSSQARLVLVAAPAGFGKTTLLTEWVETRDAAGRRTAWVSLDEADADPVRFWTHVLSAVDRQVPGVAEPALEPLSAPRPPEIATLLVDVVNGLAAEGGELALVLDDFHLADPGAVGDPTGQQIVSGIGFLVDHLPQGMVLVIATRSDPPLPLARLRARGELVELRAADLRMSMDEAREFLTAGMALPLSEAQAGALHARTEGWVAGLQLAGLALRSRGGADVDAFISAFAGSDRFVVDYLAEEVVQRQRPEVVEFLRRTCLLDRMTGPLCDAMTSETAAGAGQATLEALEQANLFLTPLDGERTWYRYHPLFAEVLRVRLLPPTAGNGDLVRALHDRASHWFEAEELLQDAIEHAFRAGDTARAAALVEALPQMQFVHPIQVSLRGWLAALPAETVRSRPRLALLEAWRLLQAGDVGGAMDLVQAAEDVLDAGNGSDVVGQGANERGEIEVIRGFLNLGSPHADPADVVRGAERALDQLDDDNVTFRGMAHLTLGHGALLAGDAIVTEQAFAKAEEIGRIGQAPHVAVMSGVYLAAAHRLRGHHREAQATARSCLSWAAGHRLAVSGRVGLLHLLLGDLAREAGEYAAALEHSDAALRSARLSALPPMLAYALLGRARALHTAGDLDGALRALDEALTLLPSSEGRDRGAGSIVAPWEACRAQLWLNRGDLAAAERWADEHADVSTSDLLSGVRPGALAVAAGYECEHVRVAPAQVWIAAARARNDQEALERALAHLDAQAVVVEGFGLGWLRVKVLALRALALAVQADEDGATATLEEALGLAVPEGYLLLFAQEGAPMAALLTRVRQRYARSSRASTLAYLDRLIALTTERPTPAGVDAKQGEATLVDPLTDRELEVLGLIAAGKNNAEIARAMFVAPSTVKTHVNHVFGKLGVASRTQAVARARELGLL